MDFQNTLEALKTVIESNKGISIFANRNAKFENWMQVELCGILSKKYKEIIPEPWIKSANRGYDIDVEGKIAIELKIFTTSPKSASRNVESIIKDIKTLRELVGGIERLLIFVVFPTTTPEDQERWEYYKNKITDKISEQKLGKLNLQKPLSFSFFAGEKKGLLYLGKLIEIE